MKQPSRNFFAAAGGALLAGALLVPASSFGQGSVLPAPNAIAPAQPVRPAPVPVAVANDDAALASLAAEIALQSAKLHENQKLIDEKLAVIAENIRVARIFISRSK